MAAKIEWGASVQALSADTTVWALEAALTDAGLSEKFCFATMMDLAYEVPICMEEIMDEYADLPGMADLREHMLGPVRENCQRTLDLIKADMG